MKNSCKKQKIVHLEQSKLSTPNNTNILSQHPSKAYTVTFKWNNTGDLAVTNTGTRSIKKKRGRYNIFTIGEQQDPNGNLYHVNILQTEYDIPS
jgi:hypothetical protein